ncbi:unnamed protein product [Polarella glacialis]|uniref:Beta-mannosidase n=1 Tax=Polarella glacialis TaxID=89957 RepID=A0A813KEE2_POLGL|nr:unnamed protein product [Polarella glacialis]
MRTMLLQPFPSAAAKMLSLCALSLCALAVHAASAAVSVSAESSAAMRSPCLVDLGSSQGQRWRICWLDKAYGGCDRPSAGVPAVVPGTVLASMLATNFSGLDPYFSRNLEQIPDISQVGRAFYRVNYRTQVEAPTLGCERGNRSLILRGFNYIAQISVDGTVVATGTGMFRRLRVPVPARRFQLDILVEPPLNPGVNTTKDCGWTNCGQGGDHSLAKDGPVAQFALGWDWIKATPDRHTGLWDRVQLLEHDGDQLQDVFVRAEVCKHIGGAASNAVAADAWLEVTAASGPSGLLWRVRDAGGELVLGAQGQLGVPGRAGTGAWFRQARLWMPWQHGSPTLHTLEVLAEDGTAVLHSQSFGLRCVELQYNSKIDGPAFSINGHPLFLAGVNWITTDQLLRFAGNAERYENEVRLLQRAGANIIRVWGGGIAERPEFFAACDRLGMLVYQEFWMTGDNNGPQAGDYSWPLDHGVYIENVRDTVLLLRGHPSLFWWGGGNELYPSALSPPPDIDEAIRGFIRELDGSRPYVQTSALLQQMKTYQPTETSAALSVDDGPYSAQVPGEFFRRNPGLRYTIYPNRSGLSPFPLSINPEVGGPNWPTYSGMQKFVRTREAPSRKGSYVPDELQFHAFEDFNIDMTVNRPNYTNNYSRTVVDPVYDLFGANLINLSLERYSWRANLIQYVQHRSLFEGYLEHQWSWYAGVMLWKGQAPWPSLRGFVYDWYLETNAAHAGMRAALAELDHVQVSLGQCTDGAAGLFRLNRGWENGPEKRIRVVLHSLPEGQVALSQVCATPATAPREAVRLCALRWPSSGGAFLVRILAQNSGQEEEAPVEHLLSNPCSSDDLVPAMDFRNLDETPVPLEVRPGRDFPQQQEVVVRNLGRNVALLVHLRLFNGTGGEVLPVWWSLDYFNLLPGESRRVTWPGPAGGRVAVSGFNVAVEDTGDMDSRRSERESSLPAYV